MTGTRTADAAEFESQLEPILARAYGFARSLTGNGAEAEDLIQEAALAAFRAFGSFETGTDFKSWFYKILTNCHFGRYRKARRRPETVDVDSVSELYMYRRSAEAGLHGAGEDPAALVMSKLSAEQVAEAIDALPEEYRVVSRLFLVEDLKYHEIAEWIDCPVGTVRSRIHRGRKMLQKALWHVAVESGIIDQLTAQAA